MFNHDEIEKAKSVPWNSITKVNGTMSICPFHEDKTESMSVKFDKAHCFVCNKSWDKIDFVMKRDSVSFVDAVNLLLGTFSLLGAFAFKVLPLAFMEKDNFIFDESGGYQMKEPNVGKWFIPDSWREEFKELRREGLCL